jgi:hypothetical protein
VRECLHVGELRVQYLDRNALLIAMRSRIHDGHPADPKDMIEVILAAENCANRASIGNGTVAP